MIGFLGSRMLLMSERPFFYTLYKVTALTFSISSELSPKPATSATTWNMSPSNAWSNTYGSTNSQRPWPLSPSTPPTEPEPKPEPKSEFPSMPTPSPTSPSQEQIAEIQLASDIENLAVVDSQPEKDDETKTLKPEAPSDEDLKMIKGMADLATTYRRQKRYARSEMIGEEVINLRREMFGNKHLDTIDALVKLAATYHEQKKYEQSEDTDKEVAALRREVLGPKHPDTIKAMDNLAVTYREQGKYEQAAKAYEELFFLRRELLGAQHADTIDSLTNLNAIHHKQEDLGKVEELEGTVSSNQTKIKITSKFDDIQSSFMVKHFI